MKIYKTYAEQLAHAAEYGLSAFDRPTDPKELERWNAYFVHPEPKDAEGVRALAKYMGTTCQEDVACVSGHSVWVGNIVPDPYFIGVMPGCPIIICGTCLALDPDYLSLAWHEVGHLEYDPAKAPAWCLVNPEDAMFCHWSPKAVRHEEQADHYACMNGQAEGLLRVLKRMHERFVACGMPYTGDTLDRIHRVENFIKTGEWVDDGLTRLPTKKEVREAAAAKGVDALTLKLFFNINVMED